MIALGAIIIIGTVLSIFIMCAGYMGEDHMSVFIGQVIIFLIGLSLSSYCFGYKMFCYIPSLVW